MTVKVPLEVQETPENSENSRNREIFSNNNNSHLSNTLTQPHSDSLDSVVQRLIDKKMGRRKQNCPQRTGTTSEEGKSVYAVLRGSTAAAYAYVRMQQFSRFKIWNIQICYL